MLTDGNNLYRRRTLNLYYSCMREIKARIEIINYFLGRDFPQEKPIRIEVMALQLRKILEFIIISNLISDREVYEKTWGSFKDNWQPTRLVKKIKKLNPQFYPTPIIRAVNHEEQCVILHDSKENFLSLDDFKEAYSFSSEILHADNPFKLDDADLIPSQAFYLDKIHNYCKKIVNLLSEHIVTLINGDIIDCIMNDQESDSIVVNYLSQRPIAQQAK